MTGVYRAAFAAQAALLIYLQVIEWVDLYPWNDIRGGNSQEALDIALGVFMLLALAATWRRWWPGLLIAVLGYLAWMYLQITTFWVPYVGGATPRWQRIHAANFSETVQWLPRWDRHLPPDASHFVLQLVLLVALVMTTIALREAYRERPTGLRTTANMVLGGIALTLGAAISGCIPPPPSSGWIGAFGYTEADVHSLDVGDFGFPYVLVRIGSTRLWLPFDTGNMVGLSVSSVLFDQLGLTADGYYDRVNSAGETVATLRVADALDVSVLGRDLGPTRIYELDHPSLPGLVGPTLIEGGHFTLDYGSRRMGVGTGNLPDSVPGFRQIPLIRSSRHPLLILVRGTIEGRGVLLELDTGKSRTVISPALSSELALRRGTQGVAIDRLRIGDLSFEVPSAKEVDQTAIDPSLPEPILAGIGSDILSRFVWTVDYEAGVLWIPATS